MILNRYSNVTAGETLRGAKLTGGITAPRLSRIRPRSGEKDPHKKHRQGNQLE